jgi:hypothetical protein
MRNGDVLIVWKLDRLGRSLPHLIEAVTGGRPGARAWQREGFDPPLGMAVRHEYVEKFPSLGSSPSRLRVAGAGCGI